MKRTRKDAEPMTVPTSYRLPVAQDAWLQDEALKQRHGRKVFVLRQVIENAMKRSKKTTAA